MNKDELRRVEKAGVEMAAAKVAADTSVLRRGAAGVILLIARTSV